MEETKAKTEYTESKDYNAVKTWKCQWQEMKMKMKQDLHRFITTEVQRKLDEMKTLSLEQCLSGVQNECLFGCMEVHIRCCSIIIK